MGLATGYTKSWCMDIMSGRKQGFSTQTATILKKAKEFVASLDGELALQSKIQPVVYMFRAKNFYDMADKQEHVITPNNPMSDYRLFDPFSTIDYLVRVCLHMCVYMCVFVHDSII